MGEKISTRVAYGRALEEFGSDENIYVFDSDLKSCTMTAYFADKYPERFFNTGIAEANMVDTAAGMAACGAVALVHTFAVFAAGRVYDQVRNSVAYPGLNVKIVGSHAGLTVGEDGATHQCIEDISLMRTIPGMTVVVPCDGSETRLATKAILEYTGPCYLRTGRCALDTVTDQFENYHFELGKGVRLADGRDVTIIACGLMVQESLKAAELLKVEGISARVIDMHTIKPIDRELILKAADETGAHFWGDFAQKITSILPLISCTAICLIIGFVIDANSAKLFVNGAMIILVVVLHNCCGYGLGFLIGKLIKMPPKKRNAIAIEIGMQNSGMASTLAASCFPSLALATVPGAIFSAWHNISGAIVANMMKRGMEKEKNN